MAERLTDEYAAKLAKRVGKRSVARSLKGITSKHGTVVVKGKTRWRRGRQIETTERDPAGDNKP